MTVASSMKSVEDSQVEAFAAQRREEINKAITEGIEPIRPSLLLPRYEAAQPEAMRLLAVAGVHPEYQGNFIDPYTNERVTENYGNIGLHCVAVAFGVESVLEELSQRNSAIRFSDEPAAVIAQALREDTDKFLEILRARFQAREHGIVSATNVEQITSDAIGHDANKPLELARRRNKGAVAAYSGEGYASAKNVMMANLGIGPEDADRIIDAGESTGHNSLASFVELDAEGNLRLIDGNLGRKIIHLVDDMTSTDFEGSTWYLAPDERMATSDFPNRYPWMWKEGFGFDSSGKVTRIKDIEHADGELRYVQSYAEWQIRVSGMLSEELKSIIDPNNRLGPTSYMKALINAHWIQYKKTLSVS